MSEHPTTIIRDFHPTTGPGHATLHINTCARARRPASEAQLDAQYVTGDDGFHVSDARYVNTHPARAAAEFAHGWSIHLDLRECDCIKPYLDVPRYGAIVTYHGSHTDAHGRYRSEGPCDCEHCDLHPNRLELVAQEHDGREVRLHHVRHTSVTTAIRADHRSTVPYRTTA